MGIFDKLTKIAEKAADAVLKTSDKINQTYQKEGFDGIVNKTADSFTKVSEKTQSYFNNIGEKNKKILESIPDKDLEGTLAKATAVVINTTQTIVKDAAKVTMDTVDSVSKNIEKIVAEQDSEDNTSKTTTPVKDKDSVPKVKELFLSEGQIAELDCMPIKLYVKHLGAQTNVDGDKNKYKLDNFSFMTYDQKWYDFNNRQGGHGSLSFIKHYICVKNNLLNNQNAEISKEIRNSSFDILSKIFELKEYQEDLSAWIKEKTVKSQPTLQEQTEEKPKRVRKTVAKTVEISTQAEPKVAKKTVKKLIVEKPLKKAVKKTVNIETEEILVKPVKKSNKPKV